MLQQQIGALLTSTGSWGQQPQQGVATQSQQVQTNMQLGWSAPVPLLTNTAWGQQPPERVPRGGGGG